MLYQLALDADQNARAARAKTTATGCPRSCSPARSPTPSLDPRVLDFFAQLVGDRPAVFDAIVAEPVDRRRDDRGAGRQAGAREVDRIAANEQRLLRHPEIIAAMYMNSNARMSTVDRAVELAVRNNVRVPGLAAWDEIARALQSEKPQPTRRGRRVVRDRRRRGSPATTPR